MRLRNHAAHARSLKKRPLLRAAVVAPRAAEGVAHCPKTRAPIADESSAESCATTSDGDYDGDSDAKCRVQANSTSLEACTVTRRHASPRKRLQTPGRREKLSVHTPATGVATAMKKRPLSASESADVSSEENVKRSRYYLLQSAFGPEDRIDETSWLTGTLIDLVLWKFANLYPTVHFLPTAFYSFHLEAVSARGAGGAPWSRHRRHCRSKRDYQVRDVLGRLVDYDSDTPIVFIVNVGLIHWNLFRVQLQPTPRLQLFEPMGRLASRTGISYRSVPRPVIEWLETCYPQHEGWLARTVSAITHKQQVSGFDCGVACLLYADKCGRGQSGEEINAQIDQQAITSFRKQLQLQLCSFDDANVASIDLSTSTSASSSDSSAD